MTKIYKKRGRKKQTPNEAEFNMLYYDLDMSAEQVAKHYGISVHTVYNWAYRFRKEEKSKNA